MIRIGLTQIWPFDLLAKLRLVFCLLPVSCADSCREKEKRLLVFAKVCYIRFPMDFPEQHPTVWDAGYEHEQNSMR